MQYQQTVTIGETTYTIHKFPATKALKLLARLVKLAGSSVSALAAGGGLDAKLENVVGPALNALFENLDEESFVETMKQILSGTYDGNDCVTKEFDSRFQGKLDELFQLAAASLKAQYGSFSNVLKALSDRAKAMGTAKG